MIKKKEGYILLDVLPGPTSVLKYVTNELFGKRRSSMLCNEPGIQ